MIESQFNRYKELKTRKEIVLNQIKVLHSKTSAGNISVIEEGWIDLSYGNGIFSKCICDSKNTLKLIKDLLIKEHDKELTEITTQMNNL